jgi:putative peptidoglycan lipid II flippase
VTSARRTFAAVVGVTLAGHIGTVAYEVAVAGRFGTGVAADALALSLTLAVAVANEIVTWISTLFIPHYLEAKEKESSAAAVGFFRSALLGLLVGTGGLALLLILAAPSLVALLAPQLAAGRSAAGLLRLFGALLILLPLSTLLAGALQAHERFVVASTRQLCWYGMALLAVIVASSRLGPAAVPIGMALGLLLFCGFLWGRIRVTLDLPPTGAQGGPRLRRLAVSLLPLAVASAANYLNVTVERGIAGRLPQGSLAGLTYASRLLNFPVNLFILNATAILFPTLASLAARDETSALEARLERALRLTFAFTIPLAGLAVVLAEPVIRVLLERGAFTAESTRLTAAALQWYAPGLIGIAGAQVLVRAYQALHEIGRMVWTGIAVVALNLALMPTLTALFGFRGLPAAISASSLALFVVMLAAIRPRLAGLSLGAVLGSGSRILVAAGVATLCGWLGRAAGGGAALGEVVAGALAGLSAYAVVLFWLSREDARSALAFVAPFLARRS